MHFITKYPLIIMVALSACSAAANEYAFPKDFPMEIKETFQICMAAMENIDSAINIAELQNWSVKDNRTDPEYKFPQLHRQSATASRKYPGERLSGGKGQRVTFGREVYPQVEMLYCNELKFRDDDFESYDAFYKNISALDFTSGKAITFDACKSKRCKDNISGRWSVINEKQTIFITSSLDDSAFNLTFQTIKTN